MIDLARISYDLPGRQLFDELSFRLNGSDRIALVGPNGSGKTTLLRMMCGSVTPDAGQVARVKNATVGYLPQDGIVHQGRDIISEARSVFDDVLRLKAETEELEVHLEEGRADEESLSRYAELHDEFRRRGGFEIDARVASVLDGLGFERADWDKDAATLSGGWQMRLALSKLLIQRPDVLLLDEPTNHLDLIANNWLEEFLGSYPGAFVLVSHDRHFLDSVVTHVAELRLAKLRLWTGNYTRYLAESEKENEALEERKRRQDEQIDKMERFIGKFRYKATKAKQVQSRIKMLDKVERIELARPQAAVAFRFPEPPRSGRRVAELERVSKSYGDKRVFTGVDLLVERGDRLALVGANGAGKSTLMRILAGREEFTGKRRLGHNVSPAYFAQDEGARLDDSSTVLEEVTRVAPLGVVSHLRSLLGSFLFRGDDVFKPIAVLSGGERTRVALAKMLLEPHNLLLLDEPTNHLDLASKEVLLQSLLEYTGTIVIVSHDRYFLDRLATRIADVGGGGAALYPGGYEDFLSRSRPTPDQTAPQRPAPQRPAPQPPAPAPAKPPAEARAARRPRPPAPDTGRVRRDGHSQRERSKRREVVEKRIEEVEAEVRQLEERMATPGFFADPASRQQVERHQSLMWQVKELYEEWEGLGS